MGEESGERMEVEFDIVLDDLVAFNEYHVSTSPTARRQFLFAWVVPPAISAGIAAIVLVKAGSPMEPSWLFWLLLFLVVFTLLYLVDFPRKRRKRIEKLARRLLSEGKNKGILGAHRLSITPEAVRATTEFGDGVTKWPAVEKIAVTDAYAFIYVGAVNALIVPRRAFADESEFQKLVETAERFRQDAS